MEMKSKTERLNDFSLLELTQKYGESEALKIWNSLQLINSMSNIVSQETLTSIPEEVKENYKKVS